MRTVVVVSSALVSTVGALAQGTINFATRVTGQVDAKMFCGVPGVPASPMDGSYLGQLYAGPPGGPLSAVGSPVPFRSDAGIGYITAGGKVVVPGVPGGSPATVELRAWKASLGTTYEAALLSSDWCGYTGRSSPITITLGGGGSPPTPDATLVGLQGGLVICPEPSAPALAALGVLMLALSRSPRSRTKVKAFRGE